MKKNRLDRDIVIVLVATLITITTWVGLEVYIAYHKQETPVVEEKYLQQFEPTLDTDVLNQLQKRLP